MEKMSYIDTNMIVWVDETESDRHEGMRRYSYSLRGMTPAGFKIGIRGKCLSVTAAMSARPP